MSKVETKNLHLTINGKAVEVPQGSTVFQACQEAGVEVPHFCYHERLEIAGNCRMCLVELEKAPKPIASCAYPAAEGMVVNTQSDMVKKAREGVMEFLLINHPLDCPICDQGGECDLQDEAMAYGGDRGRYAENRRAVAPKYMGPLIKTEMNRCIHCTRCVRFITEVAGVEELGAIHRGEHTEITTYVEKALTSELSGNIIDLCPVGALTSKPYAFKARSWELKKTETVDIMDAVGSFIRVDSRGNEVMRILPRLHEDINEEWLADKARFSYDGLKRQRLDTPYLRKNGRLQAVSWDEALTAIAARAAELEPTEIAALVGDMADSESMFALKQLMMEIESPHFDCRQDGSMTPIGTRAHYLFNTTIAGIEASDLCLLIGTNPRFEAPLINARIRKRALKGGFDIGFIGPEVDLTYGVEHLGDSPASLSNIMSTTFGQKMKAAKKPMLILGAQVFTRGDADGILKTVETIMRQGHFFQDEWNGYNVLQRAASRVAGLDMAFIPQSSGLCTKGILAGVEAGTIKMLYLLGADEIFMKPHADAFVIYQGSHGDRGAEYADVILPGVTYTEKTATFVNTEGRVLPTTQAVFGPGEAKEDWKILRALSGKMGKALPYDTIEELHDELTSLFPSFRYMDEPPQAPWVDFQGLNEIPIDQMPFSYPIKNYYMTDPISRASLTMAKCVNEIVKGLNPHQSREVVHG